MKIELVSYINKLTDSERLTSTIEIFNCSQADFILFSGHTLNFVNDISIFRESITNLKTTGLLELKDINSSKIGNCLYKVSKGYLEQMNTFQLFTNSGNIENNDELAERLLNEITSRRQLKIKGHKFMILQCGELNILKNIQSEGNKVEFRCNGNKILKRKFEEIFKSVNVVLNPIHTPMGNQGKMERRRIFLSKNNRYYFSTSNTEMNKVNLNLKSLQYAFFNGKSIVPINEKLTANYVVKLYEIK